MSGPFVKHKVAQTVINSCKSHLLFAWVEKDVDFSKSVVDLLELVAIG